MHSTTTVSLEDYISAVKADSLRHIRITFLNQNIVLTDEDIDSSGIKFQWFLNADTDLLPGKAVMANISIPIIKSAKEDDLIWNGEFTVELGQEVGEDTEWTLLGYFQGSRPEKLYTARVVIFNAHDRMSSFDIFADEWFDSLEFPMTFTEIYHSLCDYCEIDYVAGNELPDIMSREYTVSPFLMENVTCRDVLAKIAEACGCYARINSDGKCQLVWFVDHTNDYTLTGDDEFPPIDAFDIVPGKTWNELSDKTWNDLSDVRWIDLQGTRELFKITGITAIDTIADTKYSYPSEDPGNVIYTIVDNPFVSLSDDDSLPYIRRIFNRLNAFGGYMPVSMDCIGNALIEAGDIITITLGDDTFSLPIFCKTMVWNGGLTDRYETTGQLQREEVTVETQAKLNEAARYRLAMEEIELVASNKYDKQSGIDIKPEGIEVTGDRYVKIKSGGTFEVESENFNISNDENFIRIGDCEITETGVKYLYSGTLPDGTKQNMSITENENLKLWNNAYRKAFLFTLREKDPYNDTITNQYTIAFAADPSSLSYGEEQNTEYGSFFIIPYVPGAFDSSSPTYNGHIGNMYHRFWDAYLYELYITHYIFCGGDIRANGDITCDALYQSSSKDIKHDIKPMPEMGETLDKLKPVTFVYDSDKDERTRHGLIYEDTVEVLPYICTNDESNKAINYVELIPMLLKEIQDLRARVKQLEERGN